jgi:hypothetical protein
VLEVPSGVWADAVSRRVLLAVAPCLGAAGFGLWTVAPSYPAFAAGFVLWGMQGALQSGALEALVYEELDRAGAAPRFADVIGRATATGTVASAAAIGLAGPVHAAGGFAAVGAASVLACLAAAAVGAGLPEHRQAGGDRASSDDDARGMGVLLREGVALVRIDRRVRAALLLVPAVWAVWGALDEYAPLLAVEAGADVAAVPWLVLVVYVGVAAGGLLGGPASRLGPRGLAAALAGAAVALAAGALLGIPWGFLCLGVAFCGFQAVSVVAEARLQDAITGPARATVTSLAGLATEVASVAVFAAYAAGSTAFGHATLFVLFAACLPPDRGGDGRSSRRYPGSAPTAWAAERSRSMRPRRTILPDGVRGTASTISWRRTRL